MPETRARILLSAAWRAGEGRLPHVSDLFDHRASVYVEDLHGQAAAHHVASGRHADDTEAFHVPAAGALAASLPADHDGRPITLTIAPVLLAASRANSQAAGNAG